MNYHVVLFKNKKRKKILKSFVTSKRANEYFNRLVEESDSIIFDTQTENGKPCKFEIGIIQKGKFLFENYTTDELGRNIKIELDNKDFTLLNIKPYKVEEFIFDTKTKNQITIPYFLKTYLSKDGLKMISKLNNRIVYQKDNEIKLFSLKSESDADRFIESLQLRFSVQKRSDVLFVKDVSTAQRQYLYNLLEEAGFDRKYLYRKFTTHPASK